MSAAHNSRVGKTFTIRRVLVGWLLFCICGSLVAWAGLNGEEDHCRAQDGYLCFSDRDVRILVAAPAAAILVGGGIVITCVWKVVQVAKRRRV